MEKCQQVDDLKTEELILKHDNITVPTSTGGYLVLKATENCKIGTVFEKFQCDDVLIVRWYTLLFAIL
jgi:hypothetical protein